MRYGLQWAESDPFPHDQEIGVELEPEQVSEVVDAEPCPDVAACVPVITHFQVSSYFIRRLAAAESDFIFINPASVPVPQYVIADGPQDVGTINNVNLNALFPAASVVPSSAVYGDAAFTISNSWLQITPIGDLCGHRTRFVFTDIDGATKTFYSGGGYGGVTLATWASAAISPSNTDTGHWTTGNPINEDGAVISIYPPIPPTGTAHTIAVKMQIDLTDADFGSETWTDIGPILHFNVA